MRIIFIGIVKGDENKDKVRERKVKINQYYLNSI